MPNYKITDPETGKTIRITGDTPPSEEELTQIFATARGGQAPQALSVAPQAAPQPQTIDNPITKLLNIFAPRTLGISEQKGSGASLAEQAGVGIGLAQNLPQIQQMQDQSFQQSRDLIARAKAEQDPAKRQALLSGSRDIDQMSAKPIEEMVGRAERLTDTTDGGQLQPYERTALGVMGEAFAGLAPAGMLGKGGSVAGRIGKAALEGAVRGGVYGVTAPTGGAEEVLREGVKGGAIGGVLGGGVQAAGEVGKKALQQIQKVGLPLIGSQYNVPRGVAGQNRLKDTVKELSDYGLSNIDDVEKAVPKVTGSDGAITQLTRAAVGNADDVAINAADQPSVLEVAKSIVDDPSIAPGVDKKLYKEFSKDLLSEKLSGGKEIGYANPLEVFDVIKKYEKKAADLTRFRPERAVQNSNDIALGNAYKLMADELTDRLFVGAGADNAVLSVSQNQALIDQLKNVSPKLADQVKKVKTVGELRSLAAPFVRASNLVRSTNAGEQFGLSMMPQARGLGKLTQNQPVLGMLSPALSSRTLNAGLGQAISKGGALASQGAESQAAQQALNLLTRLGIINLNQGTLPNGQPQ